MGLQPVAIQESLRQSTQVKRGISPANITSQTYYYTLVEEKKLPSPPPVER